jgi:prepilin-type N-terminal cleavage/methylation domain-containing protein
LQGRTYCGFGEVYKKVSLCDKGGCIVRSKKGFTLLELAIVLAVLAIIAAILETKQILAGQLPTKAFTSLDEFYADLEAENDEI